MDREAYISRLNWKIRFRLILQVLLFVLFTGTSHAGTTDDPGTPFIQHGFYSVSYSGNNLWNPGVSFDAGFLLWSLPEHRTKRKPVMRNLYFSSGLGLYLDPGSHAALYNQYGIEYRKTGQKSWFRSLEVLPAGVYRSFLTETWKVVEGAKPERIFLPGRTYFAPALGVYMGKVQSGDSREMGWYAGCSMSLLIPYNTYVMPVLFLELGWRFSGRKEGV